MSLALAVATAAHARPDGQTPTENDAASSRSSPAAMVEASVLSEDSGQSIDAIRGVQRPPRKTVVPWIVDVYGRNYDDFENEGASRVISDWLTNALIDLDLFNIVNRERIRAVLSERNLTLTGFARDVSRDVPENELATAGKLLSVNYILLGNVKNLGVNSEIDFKLLDVETATYSPRFRLNFQAPFNPSIEKFKAVIDRIVAELAASFPIECSIREITPEGRLVVAAGLADGLTEGLRAELVRRYDYSTASGAVVSSVDYYQAELELDQPPLALTLSDYVVRIAIAPGAEALLSNGRLRLDRGQLEQARAIFREGLDKYPEHARLLAYYARSCWRLGDYEAAVVSYREALRLEPNDQALLLEAVQALFEAGEFRQVVELVEVREATQRSRELELYLGQAYAAKGYPRRAREAYKRAFRLDPEEPESHLRLAVLAAVNHDLPEMRREIRLASQAPDPPFEVAFASVVGGQLGQDPQTLSANLETWILKAAEAGNFAALTTAGELLLHEAAYWEIVLDLARRSREINPAYLRATLLEAEALVDGGHAGKAIALLEEELLTNPNNVTLLVESGELLSQTGDYPKAELRLLQAMDLAPDEWRPADTLGDHYYRQRQYLKAVSAYQAALAIVETTDAPDLVARLLEIGRSAVLGNQHAAAQSYLERCVAAAPDNTECRYYLGVCYFELELPSSDNLAIVNLKAATEFTPESFYYLGKLYDRREEFEQARTYFQQCVDSGCSRTASSQARVDEIETITGTIIGQSHNAKQVLLDVGRIHGVIPAKIALVISQGRIVGKIKTDEVRDRETEAKVKGGKPRAGHLVRFRPARPKGLTAERGPKKGVLLAWQKNAEPELIGYQVYRREGPRGNFRKKKKLGAKKTRFIDKSAKPGRVYYYRVTAIAKHKEESVATRPVEARP